jgi:hypothetical protein
VASVDVQHHRCHVLLFEVLTDGKAIRAGDDSGQVGVSLGDRLVGGRQSPYVHAVDVIDITVDLQLAPAGAA